MNITPTSHPCIFVSHDEQDAHFPGEVESSLNRLRSGPSGNNLLDELRNFESRNKRVTIERDNSDDPGARPCLTEKQQKKYGRDRVNDPSVTNTLITKSRNFLGIKKNGKGTSVTVKWSPNLGFKTDEEGMAQPDHSNPESAFVILGHELIHAKHMMQGTHKGLSGHKYAAGTPAAKEEWRAIGLGKYEGRETSEYSICDEHGITRRSAYPGFNDP
ncbi:XopG/HopH/AvrPtoH family type III secretion system effector [Xanthomonas theicola]|uniref:Type III secretion system effector protein n=1 Tax=Xanthomonas theicola TaxID=56464 RepID=A0A2S6ZAR7_9XANT|nr:XopG/HopH/AvrPtoH family type III secretion system effector [Xanthomonas theicola]PPT79422.1 hypothetical protein XthCFBP4691_18820 [Xanthomonas theicola]QNH24549.1 hypothetical protein G4Q83_07020 [Xanthomonas theicola]QNH24745.1 hypothetical protein G4Q83_08310 [Xanthomonas theicola]